MVDCGMVYLGHVEGGNSDGGKRWRGSVEVDGCDGDGDGGETM